MIEFPQHGFEFKRIVLVVDVNEEALKSNKGIDRRLDLEKTGVETLRNLKEAILANSLDCIVLNHPSELSARGFLDENDLVLSIYGGEISRNRMSLVPAVCEAHGISYIGPDAYGRVICQDKAVSKSLALEAGFKAPKHRL